ncbi:MAG: muramoyltetrapeptide carboxypeptidase [Gaiellaceae bacterium]|nr:muramoyltetrapeptide carboxypeptidase [Gaiellaceae bacterium]
MPRTVLPPRLERGDTIGIVTPSVPAPAGAPRRFERGIDQVERLGFEVRVATNARGSRGHRSGTIEERVADLHELFGDPDVRAILCAIGGFNSNSLLEELDYELIRANPKVFVGYSDVTALHAGIWSQTGLAVCLGPSLMVQFAEFDGVDPYTWEAWERTLMSAEPAGALDPAEAWTDEFLAWDEADTRRRERRPNPGPRTVRQGESQGPVVAGNLTTLLALAGTRFWPELEGALLCVEDDHNADVAILDRMLTQLRQLGAFEQVSGLALGRFTTASELGPESPLDEVVLEATRGSRFPIAVDLDFGHTDPMFCLPWGAQARLEAGDDVQLSLLEPAVSER